MSQTNDLRPTLNQTVIRQCLRRALLALAESVKTVGKLAGDFSSRSKNCDKLRRGALSAFAKALDELVYRFPHGNPCIAFSRARLRACHRDVKGCAGYQRDRRGQAKRSSLTCFRPVCPITCWRTP